MKLFFCPIFLNITAAVFPDKGLERYSTHLFYLPKFSSLTGGKGLILKRAKNKFKESSKTTALG